MMAHSAIFLATAVIAVPLFRRLGLGSVLGYLAGGALIGPSGLGLIKEVEETLHFAELGVVFLLFILGLELRPNRLWSMRGAVFGMGGAQVALVTLVLCGFGAMTSLPLSAVVVASFALALSSTAFATQILAEKGELTARHGRAAFGVLLFQDLVAIPALAIVPALGHATPDAAARNPWVSAGLVIGVVVGLVVLGRVVLRPILRIVADTKSHELSTALALLVVLATGLAMEAVGLSMALGAFLAGVLLASSEYRHDLEANIEPFKGLLLGLFFIAVGMSANLGVLVQRPVVVLGVTLILVVVKLGVLFGLARAARLPVESAVGFAVAIGQGGEFAFVLFAQAAAAEVLGRAEIEVLILAVTLSMAVTPLLFMARDRWLVRRNAKASDARPYDEIPLGPGRVIIAGFGRFGQIVGRVLSTKHIPFTALDASPTHVDFVRRFGNEIYYGDASRVDLLRAAKAEEASLFVLAVDDPEASMRVLEAMQHHFPTVPVIARARNRQHAYRLHGAGVSVVIRETFASSLDMAEKALVALGIAPSEAHDVAKRFQQYDEARVLQMAPLRGDEKALIAAAREYSAELERIFDDDASARAQSSAATAPNAD